MHNVRKISILHKFWEKFLKILLFVKIVESEFSQYLDFSKKKKSQNLDFRQNFWNILISDKTVKKITISMTSSNFCRFFETIRF